MIKLHERVQGFLVSTRVRICWKMLTVSPGVWGGLKRCCLKIKQQKTHQKYFSVLSKETGWSLKGPQFPEFSGLKMLVFPWMMKTLHNVAIWNHSERTLLWCGKHHLWGKAISVQNGEEKAVRSQYLHN